MSNELSLLFYLAQMELALAAWLLYNW
jgi:hypothetical protein